MLNVRLDELTPQERQAYLQAAIGPRPIAFASTVDRNGNPNLSPFSFFNVFSSNPPILIFSPARRVRDNTTKDTLRNVEETREVVINVVNYNLVQQASLSSTEYETGVNEFIKAGLSMEASIDVAPPRVKESPVQMECKVTDIVSLGNEGGAGNLVICEILRMHINPDIINADGQIDQHKIDLVARLGGNWYSRASGDSLFQVEKPLRTKGIGVDAIPPRIRNSYVFDGNDLGMLGNVEALPSENEIREVLNHPKVVAIFNQSADGLEARESLHHYAKELLNKGKVNKAWKVLLCDNIQK
ncbi:MAG: flavin reductase family protein [Flavobacteriales bacterium]|nr:MAG: flavin reductase family protein [Flavobacteriales bacterium]